MGLALFPIHNVWLTDLVTTNGEVGFFLPAFGAAVWLMGTLLFITWNWEAVKQNGLGDKKVFIPLLIIVGAIGLSGITVDTLGGKFAPFLMGVSLFALYLVARILGKDMFLPLVVGAVIASLGVVIAASSYNQCQVTGGVVFERNYDIVVGYVLLGIALFIKKYQWVLVSLVLVAMFLTGSPEAVFVVGVLVLVILLRRDWGKKLVVSIAPVVIIGGLFFGIGCGQSLYGYVGRVASSEPTISSPPITDSLPPIIGSAGPQEMVSTAVDYRLNILQEAISNLKPLGEGYILTDFSKVKNVHNVPLVIVQQLGYPGILAGVAWLFVSVYCLIKTKLKYTWALVLSLSVFDHFIWTQLAPWWWAIIGVSTTGGIKNDLIFRKVSE